MVDSVILVALFAAAHLATHPAPACPPAAVPVRGGGMAERTPAGDRPPVHINAATAEELTTLPGIGPKKAERILKVRERGPFRRPGDLRRVKGFGIKTIQRLTPRLVFD